MHALDLPEIRHHLAQFITNTADALACISVSHAWHETFYPCVWRSITIFSSAHPYSAMTPYVRIIPGKLKAHGKSPTISQLLQNASLIHELRLLLPVDPAILQALNCPTLYSLDIVAYDSCSLQLHASIQHTVVLIHRSLRDFRCLKHLTLDGFSNNASLSAFFSSITVPSMASSPSPSRSSPTHIVHSPRNLDSLCLRFTNFQDVDNKTFWSACATVKSLEFRGVVIPFPTTPPFLRLKHLRMFGLTSMNVQGQLQFLSQCPNLKTLHWGVPTCSLVEVAKTVAPMPSVASSSRSKSTSSLISSLTWSPIPNVDTLVLHGAIKDPDVALILSWVKQLRKLTVFCRKFAHRSLEELRRHYHEVQEIRLEDCPRVTDTMIQEIMEQCSKLQVIKAPTLRKRERYKVSVEINGPS